jgi:uncharacterized membrane protein YfcA
VLPLILLFVLVTLGSLVSGITGLAGGTLILAGLLLIYPPELAIPLHSFTLLAANGLRVGLFWKHVKWKVVFAYGSLMIPMAWLAALLFEHVNPSYLKILVGVFIISSIFPWKFKVTHEPSLKFFAAMGAVSGFLGVFVGSVGPMVTPFFNRIKIERQGNLSTKSAGQFLLQFSKIVAFTGAAGMNFMTIKDHVLILILGSIIGVGISIPISRKISDKKFDQMVNVLLGLIALKILIEGLKEVWILYA